MTLLETSRAYHGQEPMKYFGKWPFQRVGGCQEVVSVALSLANFAAHLHNLLLFKRLCRDVKDRDKKAVYPYYSLWIAYFALCLHAWLWSVIFHARDTKVTERMDYFAVDALIIYGLFLATVRSCQFSAPREWFGFFLLFLSLYLYHVWRMLFRVFDYALNVQVCIAAGLVQSGIWAAWATLRSHPSRITLLLFLILVNAAVLLEVVDFPPIGGFIDSHALWHGITVPLAYVWHHFIRGDVLWTVGTGG